MKKKVTVLLSLLVLLLFTGIDSSYAQSRSVNGTVTSAEDGQPLPGVTVRVKGTDRGTSTNIDGEYSINVTSNDVLVYSYVGFLTQEQPVGERTTINVELMTDVQQLEDVVVTGYGTIVKEDMTGNISKVSGEQLAEVPVTSFESALQGQASGVFIQKSNGKLGQGINIRVRGTSSISASSQPLYVIDGIPVTSESQSQTADTNPMSDLNSDDIESIEILKDAAAAAIYGSRGANGVVLVTTKKGKAGRTNIDLRVQRGVSSPTGYREFLNTDEYIELFTEAAERSPYGDLSGSYLEDNWFDYFAQGTDWRNREVDINWQDEAFQEAFNTDVNLQISGGNEKTRFYVSGGFSDEVGIVRGNEFNKLNARINLDHTASDKFNVGLNLGVSRSENGRVSNDNAFSTPMQAIAQPPLSPIYDPEDKSSLNENTLYYNFLRHVRGVRNNQTVFRNIGNLYADYSFLPSLTFRSEVGIDLMFQNEDYFADSQTNVGENTNGYGDSRWVNIVNYTTNNYFTWKQLIGQDHDLQAVAGMSFQGSNRYRTYVSGTNFPTDSFTKLQSAADITGGYTDETVFRFLSYFGRANYKFKDRYLFSASARVDGSSRFGKNARYGFFPAVSAGWILSQEEFIQAVDAISFLKARASYGLTGNASVGNFPSRGLYEGSGYAGVSGLVPTQTPNPDLRWERTTQYNVGLDFGLFNDRITGELDYYTKKTADLLLDVNVPATTGFTTQLRNVGKLENKGFEVVINTHNMTGDFQWTSSFNIAMNRNKVTDLDGQIIEGGFLNRAVEGEAIAVMFGKEYAGVNSENGDALYYLNRQPTDEELNNGTVLQIDRFGDGYVTNSYAAAEDVVIGNPNPDFIGGLNNRFSYKNFDLNVLLQFVYGNDVYNGGGRYQSANGDFFDNQTRDQLNRWQEPGDITDVPEARLFGGNGSNPSSRYIQDASYLRVKNVNLGYTMSQDFVEKLQVRKLRIFASAVNLFTFTKYDGWDPEVNTDLYDLSDNLNIGNDFYSAPQARTITLGIDIGF